MDHNDHDDHDAVYDDDDHDLSNPRRLLAESPKNPSRQAVHLV